MKIPLPAEVEAYRIMDGPSGSRELANLPDGVFGAFRIPVGDAWFYVIASSGYPEVGIEWEHVSVSHERFTPKWEHMDAIKRLFWHDDEAVMQLHPPRSQWVNNHSRCLHLWRPNRENIPLPPARAVGLAALGVLS